MRIFFVSLLFFCHCLCGSELDVFMSHTGNIDIAGGTAHIPVLREAARNVMTVNDSIKITIAGGGSGVGVQKVGAGLVDIGTTGRELFPEEKEKYALESYAFAVDGIAVVVNATNKVRELSSQQVRDIYTGKIRNWKYVGGEDAPIHLYGREDASATRDVFQKALLNGEDISGRLVVVASNGAMKSAVARDFLGMGYLSIGYVDDTVKSITLDGIVPSQDNAVSGEYPVVRKLFMHTPKQPTALSKAFIDYIMSGEGRDIIVRHGYFPLNPVCDLILP